MNGQERSFHPWTMSTRSFGSAATASRRSGTAPGHECRLSLSHCAFTS